jgi:hypothetical protein
MPAALRGGRTLTIFNGAGAAGNVILAMAIFLLRHREEGPFMVNKRLTRRRFGASAVGHADGGRILRRKIRVSAMEVTMRSLLVAVAIIAAADPASGYSGGCRVANKAAESSARSAIPPELAGLVTLHGGAAGVTTVSRIVSRGAEVPITIQLRKPRHCGETPAVFAGR